MIRCFLRDGSRMGGCNFRFCVFEGGMACGGRVLKVLEAEEIGAWAERRMG